MFGLKLNTIIQMLVDKELDHFESVKILNHNKYQRSGVYVTFYITVSDYTNKHKVNRLQKCVHMLFFGNTSVFYSLDQNTEIEDIPTSSWINTSNHDSCWRSDGFQFLFDLEMEMCNKVNSNIAPINLERTAEFLHSFSYPINHCIVTFKKSTDYSYDIIEIKNV